jgi:hypothetical protein
MLISEPMESIKCPSCQSAIVRPIGASTICACTHQVPATEAKK